MLTKGDTMIALDGWFGTLGDDGQFNLYLRDFRPGIDQKRITEFAAEDLHVYGDGFGYTAYIQKLGYNKATPKKSYRRWLPKASVIGVEDIILGAIYYRVERKSRSRIVLDYLLVDRQVDEFETVRATGLAYMMGMVDESCPELWTLVCTSDRHWRKFLDWNQFELLLSGNGTPSEQMLSVYRYAFQS